jgi:hypothetical protein
MMPESIQSNSVAIKNVYCNNIRVSKCNTNDDYIATFNFDADTEVHELLLHEMKKQYNERSYIISNKAVTITCDPMLVGKDTCIIDTQPADPNNTNTTGYRMYTGASLSMNRLSNVAHRRPVLMSRVDIIFRNVLAHKGPSTEEGKWLIEYSSFDVKVVSRMRTCDFQHS